MILCLNSVFGTIMDISCGNMFTTMLKVKKLYTMQFRSVLALAKLLSCFARYNFHYNALTIHSKTRQLSLKSYFQLI